MQRDRGSVLWTRPSRWDFPALFSCLLLPLAIFSCHSLAQGQECRFLLPKSLRAAIWLWMTERKNKMRHRGGCWGQGKWCYCSSPHGQPAPWSPGSCSTSSTGCSHCSALLQGSCFYWVWPPSRISLRNATGRRETAVFNTSYFSLNGAKLQQSKNTEAEHLCNLRAATIPMPALWRENREDSCVRGRVAKPGKNISLHTLLWYMPQKSKKSGH